MCRHWLAWPDGTHLLGRVVANGEDKVHLRRPGLCELFPVLASQTLRRQVCLLNQFERLRAHNSRRVTSRAVSCEEVLALTVENCLGHDGTRRIPRAQEQNVVVRLHARPALTENLGSLPSLTTRRRTSSFCRLRALCLRRPHEATHEFAICSPRPRSHMRT